MLDDPSEPTIVAQLILARDAAFAEAAAALSAAPSRTEDHQHRAGFGLAPEGHRDLANEGNARQSSVRP
jgi:hypothetical protein